ncbi:hypothetical protein Pmani_039948 [Petrolisthes manimaculis]|uniref:Uncharacterized protein n=1 Tax=Petrolisthes manimaculis TaxID=1843537 RepID=A0AAE1TKU4_9EUCA|nr:hypothetical protein Pmani_039948 [Petrolisthes manimaculis]
MGLCERAVVGWVVVGMVAVGGVGGQDGGGSVAECSCGGSVTAAVLVTLLLTLLAGALTLYCWRRHCSLGRRQGG